MYFDKYIKYKDKYIELKNRDTDLSEIYFIRHGKTFWNELGKTQGEADIELNAEGIEQAEKTGKYLRKFRISSANLFSIKEMRKNRRNHMFPY